MPPFPLNSGFLSIREIERDQYLCITNNHPVSERIKTTPYGIMGSVPAEGEMTP